MTGLSKKQKLLIYEMINKGFSNKDIARMAGVDVDVIINFRGGKNVQRNESIKNVGAGESNRKRRRNTGDDANRDQDPGGKPGDQNTVDDSPGESTPEKTKPEGSAGDPGPKRIEFVGGKKSMKKKTEDAEDGEKDWTCPECGEDFNGQPETCPHCGAELEF